MDEELKANSSLSDVNETVDNVQNSVKIVQTDTDAKDGQNKCPKCGATDISLSAKSGNLRCNYCRFEFPAQKVEGLETDISNLTGEVIASGSSDISEDANNIITLKCSSCGAEVVIDTANAPQARCHWCRNTLSINQQIPNVSIPDTVLPFKLSKEEAQSEIEKFVGKRKFFAHPKFKEEFTTNNIMGVYFPYMLVDINAHAYLNGEGEHEKRRYTRGEGNNRRTYYDADVYEVTRDFDISIKGLSIESSADRLNTTSKDKTNNIINSIMPFDTENLVKFNANYINGFTSEKRDTNIEELKPLVKTKAEDIARFAANDSLNNYDRGVHWSDERLDVKGQQWQSSYLPVWLYSYQEENKGKKLLHYVAVNARTKETMGSVPIHIPKLIGISIIVEIIAIILMLFTDWDYDWIFLSAGFIYYFAIYSRYRNQSARHMHEVETKKQINNLIQNDVYKGTRTGLTNSKMSNANNDKVNGLNR